MNYFIYVFNRLCFDIVRTSDEVHFIEHVHFEQKALSRNRSCRLERRSEEQEVDDASKKLVVKGRAPFYLQTIKMQTGYCSLSGGVTL